MNMKDVVISLSKCLCSWSGRQKDGGLTLSFQFMCCWHLLYETWFDLYFISHFKRKKWETSVFSFKTEESSSYVSNFTEKAFLLDFSFKNTEKLWQKAQTDRKNLVLINKASFKQSSCCHSLMHMKSGLKQHGEAFGDRLKINTTFSPYHEFNWHSMFVLNP